MKITFFFAAFASLGVSYLSSALKQAGFNVDLIFAQTIREPNSSVVKVLFKSEDILADDILRTNPDLIAFSSDTDSFARDINLARIIKRKNPKALIIFGGVHPTIVPEYVIAEDAVDYICVGEGEKAIVDLAIALRDKTNDTDIPNIWAKKNGQVHSNDVRPLISDLDTLPFPDKDMFEGKNAHYTGKSYYAMAGRGCYNNCTYCFNHQMKRLYRNDQSSYLRHRTVDNLIKELAIGAQRYKPRDVVFLDDIFFYGNDWADQFCEQYRKNVKLPFGCHLYADFVDDRLVKNLKKAGCHCIVIAVESIDFNIRKEIFRRRETNESIIKALSILRSNNVFTYTNLVVNVPNETEDTLRDTAVFFNKNKVGSINPLILRYYPKTDITKFALEKNILSTEDVERINSGIGFGADGFYKVKCNKNIIALILTGGMFPERIFTPLFKKMAYAKENKFFVVFIILFWLIFEGLKQLFFSRGPLNGFLWMIIKAHFYKYKFWFFYCSRNLGTALHKKCFSR